MFVGSLSAPKTKEALRFLKECNVECRGVLFVDGLDHLGSNENLKLSVRNLASVRGFAYGENISGYDIAAARSIVVSERALEVLVENLVSTTKD